MKKIITLLMAALLFVGCATTNTDRPAPAPEEVAAIVLPTVTYLAWKINDKNPELAPYLETVGATARAFAESGELNPAELAIALRQALNDAGAISLSEEDAALVTMISQTLINLYTLYYDGSFVVEDRPEWLKLVLLILADGFDPVT